MESLPGRGEPGRPPVAWDAEGTPLPTIASVFPTDGGTPVEISPPGGCLPDGGIPTDLLSCMGKTDASGGTRRRVPKTAKHLSGLVARVGLPFKGDGARLRRLVTHEGLSVDGDCAHLP